MSGNISGAAPVIQQAGQHVIKKEDTKTEVKNPWTQTWLRVPVRSIVYFCLTAIALWIGTPVFYLVGGALCVALCVVCWIILLSTADENSQRIAAGIALALNVIIVAAAVTAGPVLVEQILAIKLTLRHPLLIAWGAGYLLLVIIRPLLSLDVRFDTETTDPNYSPPRKALPGWVGPLNLWGYLLRRWEDGAPDREPEVVIEERERVVSRPAPIAPNRFAPMPEVASPQQQERNNGNKTLMAPSGREATLDSLRIFLRYAPQTGPGWQIWKARAWKYEQWCDVIDILAIIGAVSEREGGKKITLVDVDFSEVMGRLVALADSV